MTIFRPIKKVHLSIEDNKENIPPKEFIKNIKAEKKLDPFFICGDEIYEKTLSEVDKALDVVQDFDVGQFLTGELASYKKALEINEKCLQNAQEMLLNLVKQLSKDESISLEKAFKNLIGVLDRYDEDAQKLYKKEGTPPKSTFALHCALLLASQNAGVDLASWMVYTKGGKPDSKEIWPFLDNWKNWVPEAQGSMAKFSEITFTKTLKLAQEHPGEKVILLKGGYGAAALSIHAKLQNDPWA